MILKTGFVNRVFSFVLVLLAVLLTIAVTPVVANAADYISFEQAEVIAVEAAKELNPHFTGEYNIYDIIVEPKISANEQFYMFQFLWFSPNALPTSHAEEELFVCVGETSGNVYYSDSPLGERLLYKQYPSLQKLPVSWKTAYRDVLNSKRNNILEYYVTGEAALKDVNADNVPELFFIATTGNPNAEANLFIYTYYDGQAVELFSSTTFLAAQSMPYVIPFMYGNDFWISLYNPTESGPTGEYRKYTLSGGTLTITQTIPIEYRLYTEPDEMPDYERIAPPEAVGLDRSLVDGQSRILSDVNYQALGVPLSSEYSYSSVYSRLVERSPSSPPTTAEPTEQTALITATPTASTVYVDGTETAFDAYLIKGNNYFKIRDIAYSLKSKFNVAYDETRQAVALTKGATYVPTGGEMQNSGRGSQTATLADNEIYLDGQKTSLTAYIIGGNNYVKLRDLAQIIDFDVDWRDSKIWIESSQGYTEED